MDIRFSKHPDAIYRVIKGKPLVLNYKTGNILTLNDLGAVIWEKLPDFLSKIVENIASEYDVSRAEVQQDVSDFLDFLQKENAVVIEHEEVKRFPCNVIGERIHLEKIDKLGIQKCIPIVAKFELTYHCNLNCVHCYTITEKWRGGTLDTEGVKHIIDQLYDIGTMVISFTGGEIFARKDIWDIIEYADHKDFLIELLTNATLMTETDVERLKNYRISNVQISVYGHIPEIHDSVTGVPGSFKKSMSIIRCLTANKINTLMVTPLMKINFPGYKKIMELANRMGANHYCSYLIIERYDGSKDVYDLRLSKDEIFKFYRENHSEIPYKEKDINDAICTAGINQCSISPFGDVFPCFHNLLPINLGNLMTQSLEDIWTHSKDLENLRDLKILHLNGCPECPAVNNCLICPGMNMRANNNLLEPARVCCHNAFSAKEVFDMDSPSIDFEGRHIKKLEDFH